MVPLESYLKLNLTKFHLIRSGTGYNGNIKKVIGGTLNTSVTHP